ncbi:helix-turn-helix transcriptional regulator [Bradyrhizobium sp. USDA 4463]
MRYVQLLFQATGTTAQQFIREQRLRQAAELLADPHKNTSITEIALATGFSNSSHFAFSFKELFDCTPSEFRARQTSR